LARSRLGTLDHLWRASLEAWMFLRRGVIAGSILTTFGAAWKKAGDGL
jgi:hypothetical protein